MKLLKVVAVFSLFNLTTWILPKETSAQDQSVQMFYDQLSPYGTWIDYPTYGYVWAPAPEPGFTPYGTAGHWEWTDDGWLWVSDYAWGWAPFHYGRWFFDDVYGWLWLPGRTWGPAWVCWRTAPGYYGWTPLGPNIGPRSYAYYNPPPERWVFCDSRYINDPHIGEHFAGRGDNADYIRRSTVINNTYVDNGRHATYFSGPRIEDVQKATGREIKPVVIRENNTPGQSRVGNGQVNIYRPAVQKTAATAAQRPAPQKVEPLKSGVHAPAPRTAAHPLPATQPGRTQTQNNTTRQNPSTNVNRAQQQNSQPRQQPATQQRTRQQPQQVQPKQQPQQRQQVQPRQQPQQHQQAQPKQQPQPQQRQQVQPRQQPAPQERPAEQKPQEAPAPKEE